MYRNQYKGTAPDTSGSSEVSIINSQDDDMSTNQSFRFDLARIEAKIDIITNLLYQKSNWGGSASERSGNTPAAVSAAEFSLLRTMTAKQHVTSQLLIEGWPNKDIADVLGIGENTVKLHVRAVCKKVGTKTRGQAALVMNDIFERIEPDEYKRSSGGIPIDWAKSFDASRPDPYAHIYRKE